MTPPRKTPGPRKSSWGCSATPGPRETRCLPLPPRLPRPPLQETLSERWSSRSQTCCSCTSASTRACCGCTLRCGAPAKEPAAPRGYPASPPLPPPPPGTYSWSRWAKWVSCFVMTVGHFQLLACHRAGCCCGSPGDHRMVASQSGPPRAVLQRWNCRWWLLKEEQRVRRAGSGFTDEVTGCKDEMFDVE